MVALLEELNKDFRLKVIDLIQACYKRGVPIVPFCAYRDLFKQAILWRQSRKWVQIIREITLLEDTGISFIASIIRVVGPHIGPAQHITNAIPGLSWHQYREAVDCYILKRGQAVWDPNDNGYKIYREEGLKLGMAIGAEDDWCHLQSSPNRVVDVYGSMANINNTMLIRHVQDIYKMIAEL